MCCTLTFVVPRSAIFNSEVLYILNEDEPHHLYESLSSPNHIREELEQSIPSNSRAEVI